MRRKDLENRIKLLGHRLTLITLHWDEFEDKLGRSGLQELIDADLDELNYLKKLLAEWPKKDDSKSE